MLITFSSKYLQSQQEMYSSLQSKSITEHSLKIIMERWRGSVFFICSPIYLKMLRTESTAVIAQAILHLFVSWKQLYKIILLNCHTSPSSAFQSLTNYVCAGHGVSTPVVLLLFFIWRAEAVFYVKWSGIHIFCSHEILSVLVHWYLQYG